MQGDGVKRTRRRAGEDLRGMRVSRGRGRSHGKSCCVFARPVLNNLLFLGYRVHVHLTLDLPLRRTK
ncbi:hypothetical protein I3843_07G039500 [Carya illinoinensis]|nr:hypothetical protein I3843_07G039500 [Carya illinoinensis]